MIFKINHYYYYMDTTSSTLNNFDEYTKDGILDKNYPSQNCWDKQIKSLFTTFLTKVYPTNTINHPNNCHISWKYYVKKEINQDEGTCVLYKMRVVFYKEREIYEEKIPFNSLPFDIMIPDETYVLQHPKSIDIETELKLQINHRQKY